MKAVLNKNELEPAPPEFFLLNEHAQVFAGLRGGYPYFSDNWDEAKPLNNDNQVKLIKRGTYFTQFEKHYVE